MGTGSSKNYLIDSTDNKCDICKKIKTHFAVGHSNPDVIYKICIECAKNKTASELNSICISGFDRKVEKRNDYFKKKSGGTINIG